MTPRASARLSVAVACAGLALFGSFAWGAALRLERWDAVDLVVRVHGAFLCAVASWFLARRAADRAAGPQHLPLFALACCLCGTYAWAWLPPVQRVAAWWVRQASTVIFQ